MPTKVLLLAFKIVVWLSFVLSAASIFSIYGAVKTKILNSGLILIPITIGAIFVSYTSFNSIRYATNLYLRLNKDDETPANTDS